MIGRSLALEMAKAEKATCAVCCGDSLELSLVWSTVH